MPKRLNRVAWKLIWVLVGTGLAGGTTLLGWRWQAMEYRVHWHSTPIWHIGIGYVLPDGVGKAVCFGNGAVCVHTGLYSGEHSVYPGGHR